MSLLENRSVGPSPLFRISWTPFYVVILSAVFWFAKRTGMRSRRTPRLPAPRASSTGILNLIQDASPLNLTPTKKKAAPSFRALCGKVGNENLDERTASTSEIGGGRTPPETEVSTLENRSVGPSPLFRISWTPFYVVILSAVFRFAKRTGMRSRRTPRLPAPRASSTGILNLIQNASPLHLPPAKNEGCPIFPRPLRKGGKRESRPAHGIHF